MNVEGRAIELGGLDFIPDQSMRQEAFTRLHHVFHGGKNDVGHDAVELSGRATGQVEFLDSELGGTGFDVGHHAQPGVEVAHFIDGLNRAFTVGGTVAEHNGSTVILQSTSYDLRSGCAVFRNEHRQGPSITHGAIFVVIHLNVAVVGSHLDDGTFFDEEARKVDRLAQQSSTVVAQIEHESFNALFL